MAAPAKNGGGLQARLQAKVGPLPVWAWAAVLLGLFLLYQRHTAASSADATSQVATGAPASGGTTDSTPVGTDTGSPPASGGGSAASNVDDGLLSQLSGFQSSIDALTAAVQLTPAADPYSGSGTIDWSGANPGGSEVTNPPPTAPAPAPAPSIPKPSAQPFGGVLKTTMTKTGAKLTYYRSGRIVEQAPGKSPYVVHK